MAPPHPSLTSQEPSRSIADVPKYPPPQLKNETSWSAEPCCPPEEMVCRCDKLFTDEFNSTKLNTLRRFSGNSVTCLLEISALRLASSVWSNGATANTSICSVEPMVNATVWLADCPTSSVIPSCL